MTAKEYVQQTLAPHIEGDSIRLDADQVVTVDDFCLFFGSAIDGALVAGTSVYTAISAPVVHTFDYEGVSYSMTAGAMGYQPYLDAWHVEGLF